MFTVTSRFKYLVISVGLIIVGVCIVLLSYNQYTLQKQLESQALFDKQVILNDKEIWTNFVKVATESGIKLTPTPTPTKKLLAR